MKTLTAKMVAVVVGLGLGLGVATVTGSGCRLDPYDTGGEGGWRFPDASTDDAEVDPDVEVTPDACVGTEEVCDGEDNDCDGVADNGFDLATDAYNCGGCGNICEFDYAFANCEASQCAMGACLPGHWNNNNDSSDGCEYSCHETNDGTEVCDGVDNDCDGSVDEDFDLQIDPNNCGQCHRACSFFQGVGACVSGSCELSDCRGGFVDKDGNANNGCECMMDLTEGTVACVQGSPGTCDASEVCADVSGDGSSFCATIPLDVCDAVDNDCDGQMDEDAPAQMAAGDCYTHPVGCTETSQGVYSCEGLCTAGQPTCVGGAVVCGSQTGPAAELCDDLDNDCNGTVDDGYDKQIDPANCGGCGVLCSALVPHALPGCVNGGCVVLACLPGWLDINNDPTDGCEYGCTLTNGGVEACGDGIDNDCDGDTDEGFDFSSDPVNCGGCSIDCNTNTPFGTTVTGCVSSTCVYACQVGFYDLNGDLAQGAAGDGCEYSCALTNNGVEICDDLDNDCDGEVDDGVDKQTDPSHCGSCGYVCAAHAGTSSVVTGCANGVCQYACDTGATDLNGDVSVGDAGDGCEYPCGVTNNGDEICDGLDNDCDGLTDEGLGGSALSESCYSGPNGTDGVGPCHAGTRTCSGGGWTGCVGELIPTPELCDGVDNDCDASTDEDGGGAPLSQSCYTGPTGTSGVGLCIEGTQTCSGGGWGVCAGEITPQADVCDGQDNDCDTTADEDFNTQTDVLNCGVCNHQCTAHVGAFSYATGCTSGSCTYACQTGHFDINNNVNSGDSGDGCEYACNLTNGGVEACGDGVDNDCDDQTDEGFDLTSDENNCGNCSFSCAANTPYGAQGNSCVGSACVYTCLPNYYDLNNDLASGGSGNGCEYNCTATGAEICDDLDNDCDGDIDEDFLKDTNPNNCGSCGYVCASHAGDDSVVTGCVNGICQFACQLNFHDLNGDVSQGNLGNGCEYGCTVAGAETCNGDDDDCDGMTDEDGSGAPLAQACYTGGGTTEGVGLCHGGTETCTGGGWGTCAGQVTPVTELCDGADNDCDNQVDEDFNTQTDVNNCGDCNQSCWASLPDDAYPNSCAAGVCQYSCFTGYADNNNDLHLGTAGDGCEYTCPVNPPTAEYCDGEDNDCDGFTDEGLTPPAGFCYQGQAGSLCDGVTALCEDPDGGGSLSHSWYCQYPAGVETDPNNPNQLLGYETLCDTLDGDCDGVADDNFHLTEDCDNGDIGACRVTGTLICDVGDPTQAICDLPDPTTWPEPDDEECNGADDDCDGLIDENSWVNNPANDPSGVQGWVLEDLVTISTGGYLTDMYRYEASRPTATSSGGGAGNDSRSCSNYDAIPWGFVTYYQAKRACARAGMRLCNGEQWYDACSGAGANDYPYGDGYEGSYCNGHDSSGTDEVEPTGSFTNCDTNTGGIMDMSGNLREWTDDFVGLTSGNHPIYRLRGGGYFDLEFGLGCGFESSAYVADVQGDHVGFRCCSTCGNGTVEPWETCDPAPPASDSNCHPLFCGPDTCGNGTLEGSEACDDGNLVPTDGCSEICQVDASCGNGIVDSGEQCDDGNGVDLDFCSNSCLDAPTETEPNGNATEADANNSFGGSVFVIGAWSPAGDQDYYAIDVPAGGSIHVETFDEDGPSTCSGIDTEVTIYDTNGTSQIGYDDDGGPSRCSDETVSGLAGGTYYVLINEYGNNATGNYTVRITVTP